MYIIERKVVVYLKISKYVSVKDDRRAIIDSATKDLKYYTRPYQISWRLHKDAGEKNLPPHISFIHTTLLPLLLEQHGYSAIILALYMKIMALARRGCRQREKLVCT